MSQNQYTPIDRIEIAAHRLLGLLPISLASGIGAFLALADCARCYWLGMEWTRVICSNLTRLTDVTDPKILRRRLFRYAENTGRLRAEYSILERLTREERIAFKGLEHPKSAKAPIIFVSAHLSNWEVVAPAMAIQSIKMSALFAPPMERGRREIINGIRASIRDMQPGQQLISTTDNPMRRCVETLKKGNNLIVYVDEERDGLIWGPRFGRSLPNKGNRAFVARLALRFHATIIPVRIRRLEGVNFLCEYMAPLPLPTSGDTTTDTKALADEISTLLEDWIREDLDQWFWLPQLDLDRKFPSEQAARGSRN